MILNVGLRTDIVAHYSEWLFRRFSEGTVYSRNPLFPNRISAYELTPDRIDAVLFCSKNYAPVLPRLREISDRYRTLFHYTINGYGRDIEPRTPDFRTTLSTLKELAEIVGRERIFWRYDPILFTDRYTAEFHLAAFSEIADAVRPYVSECIVNFVEGGNLLNKRIRDVKQITKSQKRSVLAAIGSVGRKYALPMRICGITENYAAFGVDRKACVVLDDIAKANGCVFRAVPHTGNRRNCSCIPSRDIGWYDSCPSKCRYCNANRDESLVETNLRRHDPASPLLIGYPQEGDQVTPSPQKSFLANDGAQLSLFDME